jgi:hypothetical protein
MLEEDSVRACEDSFFTENILEIGLGTLDPRIVPCHTVVLSHEKLYTSSTGYSLC